MTINRKIPAFIFVILILFTGCNKAETEITVLPVGTFWGEKNVLYSDTHLQSVDTITIEFNNNEYVYSGCNALDFGSGSYLITKNSIQFKDTEVRNALYSWDWILVGTYTFRLSDDSIVMNQNGQFIQVTCRLKKVIK